MSKYRNRIRRFDDVQIADAFVKSMIFSDSLEDPIVAVEFATPYIYVWYVEEERR